MNEILVHIRTYNALLLFFIFPKVIYVTIALTYIQEGYKEREDRIAALEALISNQNAKLEKIRGTVNITVRNVKVGYWLCLFVRV